MREPCVFWDGERGARGHVVFSTNVGHSMTKQMEVGGRAKTGKFDAGQLPVGPSATCSPENPAQVAEEPSEA